MMAIPKKVSTRLITKAKEFQSILKSAQDRDVNEADTSTIVADVLADVFGYDKYAEITKEHVIRGTFCDLAVELEGKVKFLIEVKAIGQSLKSAYLKQAIDYGANSGIDWVVLTNGVEWQINKIIFERPIKHELVCEFSMLDIDPRSNEAQEMLYLLCKEGITKAAIEDYHNRVQIVNQYTAGALILSEPVIAVIRREMKKLHDSVSVTKEEIEHLIETEVIKKYILESEQGQEAQKKVSQMYKKKARQKAKQAVKIAPDTPEANQPTPPTEDTAEPTEEPAPCNE